MYDGGTSAASSESPFHRSHSPCLTARGSCTKEIISVAIDYELKRFTNLFICVLLYFTLSWFQVPTIVIILYCQLWSANRAVAICIRMPTVVREISVISSSIVAAKCSRMRRKSRTAFVIRDYTPVTPDRPVMSWSVSNGNHVTLADAAIRLRVLLYLERGVDCVELWRECRTLVDAIRRGGRLVETRLLVQVERSGLQLGLEVFAVRTGTTVDLVTICKTHFKERHQWMQSKRFCLNHLETT